MFTFAPLKNNMNTKILFLAIMLTMMEYGTAQNFDPQIYNIGKKYPGYIIKLNNDTVRGFIEAKERCTAGGLGYSNQNRCEFYLNENDRKATEKYGPKELKGYMIADKFYKSIPYSGGLVKSNNFCLLLEGGRISRYVWYKTKEGFVNMNKNPNESTEDFDKRRYDSQEVCQKLDEDCFTLQGFVMAFAKKMSQIVSDYPELSEKIANKEKGYKVDAFYKIIEEYNTYFANKK